MPPHGTAGLMTPTTLASKQLLPLSVVSEQSRASEQCYWSSPRSLTDAASDLQSCAQHFPVPRNGTAISSGLTTAPVSLAWPSCGQRGGRFRGDVPCNGSRGRRLTFAGSVVPRCSRQNGLNISAKDKSAISGLAIPAAISSKRQFISLLRKRPETKRAGRSPVLDKRHLKTIPLTKAGNALPKEAFINRLRCGKALELVAWRQHLEAPRLYVFVRLVTTIAATLVLAPLWLPLSSPYFSGGKISCRQT